MKKLALVLVMMVAVFATSAQGNLNVTPGKWVLDEERIKGSTIDDDLLKDLSKQPQEWWYYVNETDTLVTSIDWRFESRTKSLVIKLPHEIDYEGYGYVRMGIYDEDGKLLIGGKDNLHPLRWYIKKTHAYINNSFEQGTIEYCVHHYLRGQLFGFPKGYVRMVVTKYRTIIDKSDIICDITIPCIKYKVTLK